MNILKKVNVLILGLVVLFALGCNKDDDGSKAPEQQECSLSMYKTPIFGHDYERTLVYDSQGRVTSIQHTLDGVPYPGDYEKIEYNQAGQVFKVSTFEYGRLLDFTTFFYNHIGQVEMVKEFFMETWSPPAYARQTSQTSFFYNADKRLLRKIHKEMNNRDSVEAFTNYFYYSANTAKAEVSYESGPVSIIQEYTFDDKKTPTAALLTPNIVGSYDFQNNNILHFKETNLSNNNQITNHYYAYQYNDENYPVTVTYTNSVNNIVSVTNYTYNCQ